LSDEEREDFSTGEGTRQNQLKDMIDGDDEMVSKHRGRFVCQIVIVVVVLILVFLGIGIGANIKYIRAWPKRRNILECK
jgi:hypothetical protein